MALPPSLGSRLLRVAWLSILLGVGVELMLVAVALGTGKPATGAPVVADGAQKISWSIVVCSGLALGMTAGQLRPSVGGLAGLLAAPIAFTISRAVHKSAAEALALPAMAPAGPSPWLLAAVKGIEYAALGLALTSIARRGWGGLTAYAGAGAIAGIVFGGTTLWLTVSAAAAPPSLVTLLPRIVNELLFPVGCALVLYTAGLLTAPSPAVTDYDRALTSKHGRADEKA